MQNIITIIRYIRRRSTDVIPDLPLIPPAAVKVYPNVTVEQRQLHNRTITVYGGDRKTRDRAYVRQDQGFRVKCFRGRVLVRVGRTGGCRRITVPIYKLHYCA